MFQFHVEGCYGAPFFSFSINLVLSTNPNFCVYKKSINLLRGKVSLASFADGDVFIYMTGRKVDEGCALFYS